MNRDGIPALERQNPWQQRKHAKLESVFEEKILTAMGFDQRGPQFLRPRDHITGGEGGRRKKMGQWVGGWGGGGARGVSGLFMAAVIMQDSSSHIYDAVRQQTHSLKIHTLCPAVV